MAYNLVKKYPDNFSKDITDVIDALTLTHGKEPHLYGSGSFKIDYPSDYDLEQQIPLNKFILSDIQSVIKKILKMKNTYIGDIKCGMIPDLQVVDMDLNQMNYNDKRPIMIKKINDFYKDKIITLEEKNDALSLLKPDLKEMDIYIIKEEIKYETIRWKPNDILNGFVNYRGYKIGFYDYLTNEGLTKIDVITWLNGMRYNEISMVYIFLKDGVPLNRKRTGSEEFIKVLIEQIPYLLFKKKYMKICKRINSIERAKTKPDEYLLYILNKLFNSSLGRLNQVLSDITTLEFLIDNIKSLSKEKFNFEIDQLKFRLGNMTNRNYLSHEDKVIKLLNILEKDTFDFDALESLRLEIFNLLESETLKFMKEYELYPIPKIYLPQNISGEGVIDKAAPRLGVLV